MIEISGKYYDLKIDRKRNRNIYLRVEGNTLHITCPYFVSKEEIMNFIYSKANWINKTSNKKDNSKCLINDTIYYLGKQYRLVIEKGNRFIKIEDDTIYIKCRDESIEKASKVFYEYGKRVLKYELTSVQDKYLNILKEYGYNLVPEYKFKYLTSMWGCCYSNKNLVNLSVRLIHFDEKCFEAVLWHELLHFIIPNHSKRFHEVLAYHMPDYEAIIKTIK